MEILKDTILKKKVQLSTADLRIAIVDYINKHYPKLLDNDDDFEWYHKDLMATFTFDPYKK